MGTQNKGSRRLLVIGLVLSLVGVCGSAAALGVVGRRMRERLLDGPGWTEPVELPRPFDTDGGNPKSAAPDDPAADDGELHDARTDVASYAIAEDSWVLNETSYLTAYDANVDCSFRVSYPKLTGDLAHLDQVNDLLRAQAMQSVRTYYEDPSSQTVEMIRQMVGMAEGRSTTGAVPAAGRDLVLASVVDYAVTYNNEHFISVCYSDQCYLGSPSMSLISLRTVNVNLDTGESYEIEDVMGVDEAIATTFVDNLVQTSGEDANGDGRIGDDECLTLVIAGREQLVAALQGKGELANRVSTCFFVDGNGHVNLGANYWVERDGAYVRGWWDVTVPSEQLDGVRKDSALWDLLGA